MQKQSDLAGFLKDKRIKSGLSQKEVADKLGYTTPQFVSNWERGMSAPPIEVLKKLSDLYDVPSEEMFSAILQTVVSKVETKMKRKFYGRRSV
ncbi:MAG: helix-turn-helix transcriptional regulator [Bdellovibrio sp.]